MAGLYIHVPFCRSRCPYCDFYSQTDMGMADAYTEAVCRCIDSCSRDCRTPAAFSTLYIGGGTPSCLGAERLVRIIKKVRSVYGGQDEITVECNPSSTDEELLCSLSEVGVNRLSFGLQSAVDSERRQLGRLSGADRAGRVIELARSCGITNISLDLMMGIPGQTAESLRESVMFCLSQGVTHVSSYMLQLEPGTFFYKKRDSLSLPEEDTVCEMYLETVRLLEEGGLRQYEVSNFAQPGFESRHNLNYWDCGEYIGIGPAAHSFSGKRRFRYQRDLKAFIDGCEPVDDGDGGSFEEYAMLRLRLSDGLNNEAVRERFGCDIPAEIFSRAEKFCKSGHVRLSENRISLTPEGFLISNYIIGELLSQC